MRRERANLLFHNPFGAQVWNVDHKIGLSCHLLPATDWMFHREDKNVADLPSILTILALDELSNLAYYLKGLDGLVRGLTLFRLPNFQRDRNEKYRSAPMFSSA